MPIAVSRRVARTIAAALLLAIPTMAPAQPTDALRDLRAARDLRTGELDSAFRNDDDLCRQRAYQTALGQLQDVARQARRVARGAALATPEFSAVNAAEADALATDLENRVARYRSQLADCERRSLADKAVALDDAHEAAAGRCDRAEMQRLVRELEKLEQQAAAVVQAIQLNPGAVLISLAQAQAQLRRAREFLAAARARPPRNCPPAGSTAAPTPPPGSPTPPPPAPPAAPPTPPTPTPPAPPATPPPPAPSPAPPPPPQEFGGVGRETGETGLIAAPEGVSRADLPSLPDRASAAFARAQAAAADCDRQRLATAVRQLGTLVVQARVERNRVRQRGADAPAAAARQQLDLVTERHAEARRLQRACRRSAGRESE